MSESSRGRGKKVVAPRGRGRRTQAERDQISQAESERNRERDRQYAQEQNATRLAQERAERDRRRRAEAANKGHGRGRGGFMGQSHVKHESSGPLSGGSVIGSHISQGKAFPRPWAPSRRPGVSQTASATTDLRTTSAGPSSQQIFGSGKIVSGPDFLFSEGTKEDAIDGGYISSDLDEIEEGQRRPIEAISLLTDDEDEGSGASGFPVRLTRVEHHDRAAPVSTEAGEGTVIKTEDGDVPMADASGLPRGKSKQRDQSVELIEERPWQGVWSDPENPPVKEEPNAEAPSARAQGKSKETTDGAEQRTRRARQTTSKEPLIFNIEERNEYVHELEDNQVMLDEFGDLNSHKDDTRTYLFQFPPVLPALSVQKPITIKDDPDAPPPQSAVAAGSTSKDVPIKIEEDDPMEKKKLPPDQTVRPKHLPQLASGAVGKLRVHKSGKVTMDWGGSNFVVQNGVTPYFLQNLVMVKMDEQVPNAAAMPGAMTGVATAFGQPRGKLVVQPDWDEMLDGGVKRLKVE